MNIGFIGLGKLGLPCAEEFAKITTVYGFDCVNKKEATELVNWTDSIKEVVAKSEIIFIAVQTPHSKKYDGSVPSSELAEKDFDYSYVKNVIDEICTFNIDNKEIVLISTVLPGTIRNKLNIPAELKNKFFYNPFLIAMGSEKHDLLNPEIIILGNNDREKREGYFKIEKLYKKLINNNAPIVFGTWEEAESIKIFYNTFISAKIALVNMIQDVSVKIGNIDTDIVTGALAQSSKRITSPMYLKAGMGDGGPCHPRDNIALSYLAKEINLGYDFFSNIMISRERQAYNLATFILQYGQNVCILGKSYKPNVDIETGSYSLLVGHYLQQLGAEIEYDKNKNEKTNVFLIAHRNSFYDYSFPEGSIVIDPWREFPKNKKYEVIYYGKSDVL